jgi:hypothetical protein
MHPGVLWIIVLIVVWGVARLRVRRPDIYHPFYGHLSIGQWVPSDKLGELKLEEVVFRENGRYIAIRVRSERTHNPFLLHLMYGNSDTRRTIGVLASLNRDYSLPLVYDAEQSKWSVITDLIAGERLSQPSVWRAASPLIKSDITTQMIDRVESIHKQRLILGSGLSGEYFRVGENGIRIAGGFHHYTSLSECEPDDKSDWNFCSLASGRSASFADDIERLMYVLIDTLYTDLPWKHARFRDMMHSGSKIASSVRTRIAASKRKLRTDTRFFRAKKIFPGFQTVLMTVQSKDVDYHELRDIFNSENMRDFHENEILAPIDEETDSLTGLV